VVPLLSHSNNWGDGLPQKVKRGWMEADRKKNYGLPAARNADKDPRTLRPLEGVCLPKSVAGVERVGGGEWSLSSGCLWLFDVSVFLCLC
jgi:hypothetical protein